MGNQLQDFNVSFTQYENGKIQSGWIVMTITLGDKTQAIDTSYVYSPYEDLPNFFEKILHGKRGLFTIDQEGKLTDITVSATDENGICYLSLSTDGLLYSEEIRGYVKATVLVGTFLKVLKKFISNEYDNEAWSLGNGRVTDIREIDFSEVEKLLSKS